MYSDSSSKQTNIINEILKSALTVPAKADIKKIKTE